MKVSKRVTFDEVGLLLDKFPNLDFWEEFNKVTPKRVQKFCICSSRDKNTVECAYKWLKEYFPNVELYKQVVAYKFNKYQLIFRCY